MAERGQLFAGTSGFSYPEWKGTFYPDDLPDRKMLEDYSSKLPSVEINYTFRRWPTSKTIEGWRSRTPDGFKLTLKAPQRITHTKRLKDVQDEVDDFVRRAKGLGNRLGAILFQCPPNLSYEKEKLEAFLAALPPVADFACEFRHDSWKDPEATALLRRSGVALCGAETDEAELDSVPVTAGHAYLRLRKTDYTDDEVAAWKKRVDEVRDAGHDVYVYFKHEEGARSPRYAKALLSDE